MASILRVESPWEMLLTYARAFSVTAASVEYHRGLLITLIQNDPDGVLGEDTDYARNLAVPLGAVRELCGEIPSLKILCSSVDRISERLKTGILPLALYVQLEALQNSLFDHLKDHFYYAVNSADAELYNNEAPFGGAVFEAFPSARRDICNAAKCIVFGQGTASVFHVMRVMEVALKVLGRKLAIGYAPSWESYLTQINKKIGEKHANKTTAWKRQQPLYSDLAGDLTAIKWAWRNPTMHIVRDYDVNEARMILVAVATFMNRMAEARFKETGKPIAARIALEPEAS